MIRARKLLLLGAAASTVVLLPVAYVSWKEGEIAAAVVRLETAGAPTSLAALLAQADPGPETSIEPIEAALSAAFDRCFESAGLIAGPPYPWDDDQEFGVGWDPVVPAEALEVSQRLAALGGDVADAFDGEFDVEFFDSSCGEALGSIDVLPAQGSVEHDILRLYGLEIDPLRVALEDYAPWPRYDLVADLRGSEAEYGLAAPSASFATVRAANVAVVDGFLAAIEGDGEATLAALRRVLELAERRSEDRSVMGLTIRSSCYSSALRMTVWAARALDDEQLAELRTRFVDLDLEAEMRAAVAAEAAFGHRGFRGLRGLLGSGDLLGEYPADHPARERVAEAGFLDRARFARAHLQFLVHIEEALRRIDELGFQVGRVGDLTDLPAAFGEHRPGVAFRFSWGEAIPRASWHTARLEAKRRQVLIALQVALVGDSALDAALERWPDPYTGSAFDRVTGPDGIERMTSIGVATVDEGTRDPIECPLYLARP